MKFCIAFLACSAISLFTFSQSIPMNPNVKDAKGLRQGMWTILYNNSWKPTQAEDSISYYRIIEYKNDKPSGIVKDFYSSGQIQWEGMLSADRPKDIKHGVTTEYSREGRKIAVRHYENGTLIKEQNFNLDGSEATESLTELDNLGSQAYRAGNFGKAAAYFERGVAQAEKQVGKDDLTYVSFQSNLGKVYDMDAKYKQAEELYLSVAAFREKFNGRNSALYASAINNVAGVYEKQGAYKKADSVYQQALLIREKVVGKNHPDYARSLNSLAGLNRRLGNYEKAEDYYLKSKDIVAKTVGKNHVTYAGALSNLGGLYETYGNYKKAEACYTEAIELFETTVIDQPINYAVVLNNLGLLYSKQGKYGASEKTHLKALAIREKTVGKNHLYYAYSLQNLTLVYREQGNYVRAAKLARELLPIFEKALGKSHPDYAIALETLAYSYFDLGDYHEAEALFKECLITHEIAVGKNHPEYATSLSNLGRVYRIQNQFAKAEPYYLECLLIRRKFYGDMHQAYAQTLNNLATLYDNMGYAEKAEPLYLESIRIYETLLGKSHPSHAVSQQNLALFYKALGNYDKAESLLLESNKNYIHQIHSYFPAMSEFEKQYFYEGIQENFERFNSFAILRQAQNPSIISVMYDNQLAVKALLFNSNEKIRRLVLTSSDTLLIKKFNDLQKRKDLLAKAFQMNLEQRKKAGVILEVLEEEINTMEKELSANAVIGKDRSDKRLISWQAIKKTLRSGEAAIELIRFKKHGIVEIVTDSSDVKLSKHPISGLTDTVYYAALIVTRKSKVPKVILLRNGNDLEERYINTYKNSIKFRLRDTLSYGAFWKPIGEWLDVKKIKKIYISLDGVYNSINLNALLNPSNNRYLSEQLDVEVVTNTRDIAVKKDKLARVLQKKASLFGYPNYIEKEVLGNTDKIVDDESSPVNSMDSVNRFFAGGVISRLPGTQGEITSINRLLSNKGVSVTEYMDRKASEEQVKELVDPQILHIATHGFFLQNIKEMGDQGFAGFDSKRIAQNPLLRSGLLMAGSQHTINGLRKSNEEDGILTAYEAMNLDLEGTDLVVLSACETGLGEIRNGEGVYGLQRAFQTAGAKSILMSLWKVDDAATQELMIEFYKNWLKSGDKRDAFKKAQTSIRARYKHPYYWGAFVLVGE